MKDCKLKMEYPSVKRINARAVDYEGNVNTDSTIESEECKTSHMVMEDIYTQLDVLKTVIDTSALGNNSCIDYITENDNTITIKNALLGLESKICELESLIPSSDLCNPIYEEDLTCVDLDMSNLTDVCNNPITNLKDLLQALILK